MWVPKKGMNIEELTDDNTKTTANGRSDKKIFDFVQWALVKKKRDKKKAKCLLRSGQNVFLLTGDVLRKIINYKKY